MKKRQLLLLFLLILLMASFTLYGNGHKRKKDQGGVNFAINELYTEECGQCHLVYPPFLLPGRSWQKILSPEGLKNHFGEEFEFSEEERKEILNYLLLHSANRSKVRLAYKIRKKIRKTDTPIRITETRYISHEHDDIPQKLITQNEEVESLSNCSACHKEAEKGVFDEDTVSIPGHGKWDD